jgi:hypothetical protein
MEVVNNRASAASFFMHKSLLGTSFKKSSKKLCHSIALFAELFRCISINSFYDTGNQQNFLFNQVLPG